MSHASRNAFQNASGTLPEAEAEADRRTTTSGSDAQTRGRAVEETITARIRRTPQAVALARLILDLRPEWAPEDVHGWAATDDRPWSVVVRAGIVGASDRTVTRPEGLRYVGPQLETARTPTPPTLDEQIRAGLLPPRRTTA